MPRMKEESHPKAEASAIAEDWVPEDMDAYRIELTRHIDRWLADREGLWQRCGERECLRARSCQTSYVCPMLPPSPVLTPEEDAKWRAEFYYALQARVAEIEQGETDGIDQQS